MILRRVHSENLARCQHCGRAGHDMFYFTNEGSNYQVCSASCADSLVRKLADGQTL